jgi:adenylyltransferase/sulfurtransferase
MLPGFGLQAQRRLSAARVLVVGAGGLGSPVLLYLAAAGVGTLGLVEFDVVDASNLQRQVVHRRADVGRPKSASAADAVAALNPDVQVVRHEQRLSADHALELFARYDLVVDGADNFPTRYLVNDAAALLGMPYVWGSVFGYDGQASVFWSGRGPTYRDLHPAPPAPGTVPSCAEGGVLGAVCGVIGSVMATEAVKLVTGLGEPLLGRMLVYDALGMSFRTVSLRVNPRTAPVTGLVDYDDLCGTGTTGEVPADRTVDVATLGAWLDQRRRGERDFVLVDVREPGEHEINRIPGSIVVPRAGLLAGDGWQDLPARRPLVVCCKSGARSAEVVRAAMRSGRDDVVHVVGGVDAWISRYDPAQPRY